MEQKPEEIVANETAGSADFRRRDCNIPMNSMESVGCRLSESQGLCVTTSSDWPGSSTLTHLDTVKCCSLNGGESSLAGPAPILRSPNLTNDAGFTVEEAVARNYGYRNAHVAGCSSAKEEINHEGGWSSSVGWRDQNSRIAGEEFMSKDSLELCSRKAFRRVITNFLDVKVSSSNQMDSTSISTHVTENPSSIISGNGAIGEISAHVSEGPSNITTSNRLVGGRCSSSFSNFFFGRSQSAMRKSVPRGNPRASNESHTTLMVQRKTGSTLTLQNENVHENLSGEASDESMNRNSLSCSHDIERPHCGINLREWIESKGVNASKKEKMFLFRQIVQRVDAAHSQGIALLDLRPSSFTIFETGDVQYIGSLMETELWNTKKRGLEPEISSHENIRTKMQNLGGKKLVRPESHFISRFVKDIVTAQFSHGIIDMKNCSNSLPKVQSCCIYESTPTGKTWLTSQNAQLENKWYAFPEGFKIEELLSLNIYSLGLLLFEFLCHFESIEAHSAAMLDVQHRILPPFFLSKSPKEAGFCFWLLHPKPSSRPTTREILQSDLISGTHIASHSNNETSCVDIVYDAESDLLLHFLLTLQQDRQNKACKLLESLKFLDSDIKMVESGQASRRFSDMMDGGYDSNLQDQVESPCSSISRINLLKEKLLGNISELEHAYFSVRSNQLAGMPDMTRSDKDVLRKRDHLSWIGTRHNLATEEKLADRVGTFFDGICKFARYSKFEVCGTLRNGDILNSNNVICSLSFDPEEEYIAVAGVSKKIKIFELHSILNDYVDVQYPVLEMSSKSKFSCICWNNYIKSYLASTDYDGVVQIWDASTGQGFVQYNEHQKRAWSVDFSRVDPRKFASGGDDCSVKLWSMNERNSIGTIWNPANICCVQFSSYSSHLLSFGSADYKIYCYDLRHTRIPWCTLAGHENAVSYVRFLDAETLVSASTDNTLKLWDLKKTRLDGLSPDACSLTFRGHTNEKNFVGLSVLDGYIACGSETNEVYAYYKSLPMPISRHKFEYIDPISGDEINNGNGHFVSSVCWRRKSQMIVVANSSGSVNVLRLV